MEFLTQLWLPILLSSVLVFIVSSIIHMVVQTHNSDVRKMNNEEAVLETLRKNGVVPGSYMFPRAGSMKEMGTPEMVARLAKGPIGWLTVLPAGGFNIGKSLVWWFAHSLLIGLLVGYVGWYGLGAGAHYLTVFRVVGAAAILGYAVGHFHDSIWKGQSWGVTAKFVGDGVVYGLVTAGTFGWLWP